MNKTILKKICLKFARILYSNTIFGHSGEPTDAMFVVTINKGEGTD